MCIYFLAAPVSRQQKTIAQKAQLKHCQVPGILVTHPQGIVHNLCKYHEIDNFELIVIQI